MTLVRKRHGTSLLRTRIPVRAGAHGLARPAVPSRSSHARLGVVVTSAGCVRIAAARDLAVTLMSRANGGTEADANDRMTGGWITETVRRTRPVRTHLVSFTTIADAAG